MLTASRWVSEKMCGDLGTWGLGDLGTWGLGDLGNNDLPISLSPYLPISLSPSLLVTFFDHSPCSVLVLVLVFQVISGKEDPQ